MLAVATAECLVAYSVKQPAMPTFEVRLWRQVFLTTDIGTWILSGFILAHDAILQIL